MEEVQKFVAEGGTVIAIGGAAQNAINSFRVPLLDHLEEAPGQPLGNDKFYVPGSVVRVQVDPTHPLAHGYGDATDIYFDDSPVWRLGPAAAGKVRSVAWFNGREPLRSGWAWGQHYLDQGIQMAETNVGQGRLFLFGNELLFRTQPHGSYKFFFNGLYLSVAPEMKAGAGQ